MHALRWIALALFVCIFAAPGPARADQAEAYIDDVTLYRNDRGRLVADFRVRNALDERMVEMVESGLAVRFLYRARVINPDNMMIGRRAQERDFERILTKDNLKEVYQVTEEEQTRDFATLEEAVRVMNTVEAFTVVKLSKLDPQITYRLEMQVRLEEFQLPFYIHRVLPFFSYWDEETPWYVQPLTAEVLGTP